MNSNETKYSGVTCIVVGCGGRGEVYSSYALKHPDRLRVVGFADPRAHTRKRFAKIFEATVEPAKVFADWRDAAGSADKLADCVVVALPDKLHKEAAIAFINKGYHILLEKPMATALDDCAAIKQACDRNPSVINACCHVLRYFPPCIKIKEVIESGLIGDVLNINHTEPVGYWHFAHSFVRGNWHNEAQSSFSLLAKCCHDVDLLVYWMGDKKKCTRVHSFGSLAHFRPENAPPNSTTHCFTCPVESSCCYSAKKIYLGGSRSASWKTSVVLSAEIGTLLDQNEGEKKLTESDIEDLFVTKSEVEKIALVEACLKSDKTQYGRCVYRMDNDVCDNQVVSMQFSDNTSATLTMIATSKDVCKRRTRVYGTKGELEWIDGNGETQLVHHDFLSDTSTVIACDNSQPEIASAAGENMSAEAASFIRLNGHGGSDYWLIHSFVEAILKNDKSLVLTDMADSFKSHLIVFAAEHSRVNNKIVDINEFAGSK